MSLTGEDIRRRLQPFAAKWSVYEGSERAEAQTFCNELFACYGQERRAVAAFEQAQSGRFLDLLWPRVCLIEMKAPVEASRLHKHRPQALGYWRDAADPDRNIPSPPFVVLCAFRHLEIWEPGAYPGAPRLVLDLVELPDQYDALLFLAGGEPVFAGGQVALTRDAVSLVTDLFMRLGHRRAADPDVLRTFILQCVWCLFAEDLGLLPAHAFTRLLDDLIAHPKRSSADDLGGLFRCLNDPAAHRPAHGAYAGVPYANGSLFAEAAAVHLEPDELELLRQATAYAWQQVEPQIFGSLLEGGLGHDQQWALGAHYTAEADIQKVVQSTIVRPWEERIENLTTHGEATAALGALMGYVVLDPACGSGNFLYVAYRELRRLEARLRDREGVLRRKEGGSRPKEGIKDQETLAVHYSVQNLKGIDIDGFAIGLARLVIWIGHKLAVDELGIREATLPLTDLSGIRQGDALRMSWPRAAAIIGNPPFHGSQNLRGVLGDDYVEWLKDAFGVGIKDYCVYWFRKAHDRLPDGGRAGLVGTNSISQNRARSASLDYVVGNGGVITDAVSMQEWSGQAVVNVSIVNWVKAPTAPVAEFTLDGVTVGGITPSLEDMATAYPRPQRLAANAGRAFQGQIPGVRGFILEGEAEAKRLLAEDMANADVVRPYLVGADIATDPHQAPRRWTIDFGMRNLEEAMVFAGPMAIVRREVKPVRDRDHRTVYRKHWWRFTAPRPVMRDALALLPRYVAGTATGKRILFCWADAKVCPSNATNVFAFEDDYAMGILCSSIHTAWAKRESSTLRVDIRYTPTSAFETFPFPPGPGDVERAEVAGACARLFEVRGAICAQEGIGLTTLYNLVDEGGYPVVACCHRALDVAVVCAYGWNAAVAGDPGEATRLLVDLNAAIITGAQAYDPFHPPGAPV